MQEFSFSKAKTGSNEFANYIILTTETSLKKIKNAAYAKNWNASVLQQFEEKTEGFKNEIFSPFKTLKLSFDSGATAAILVLPVERTVFDLHTSVSSGFSGLVKGSTKAPTLIDVSMLKKSEQETAIEALASFCVLETWSFPKITKVKEEPKKQKGKCEFQVLTALSPKELAEASQAGLDLGEATNLVRTLGETPSNFLRPDDYREKVRKRSKEFGYGFKFYTMDQLRKLEAGAFVAVAKADPLDRSGIVQLTYKPKKAKTKKLTLVGKGICFDTGGYNVKTGNYMHGMHRDMIGSAVALALFEFLAKRKVPYEVNCYLAIAENLISPDANRPNDVLFAANGTSIEMVDTDAEGRLVLADTLVIASREKPDLILDFATLTGSAVRALDTRIAAVFSNQPNWLKKAVEAGETSGERTWGFPVGGDYFKKLKSDIADIRQCNVAPNADHIYAATFLSHFVDCKIPWIHMDLSTDTNPGGLGLVKTEITGFGVRWARQILENFR